MHFHIDFSELPTSLHEFLYYQSRCENHHENDYQTFSISYKVNLLSGEYLKDHNGLKIHFAPDLRITNIPDELTDKIHKGHYTYSYSGQVCPDVYISKTRLLRYLLKFYNDHKDDQSHKRKRSRK